ncbi:MAG TPA: hypothetical protein VLZ75_07610 [Chitinophagales bacterium]|nr:hypothetical protein [Chitinophagales bacterium]
MATLSKQAVKGIKRIGDVFLPGNEEFPSYSVGGGTYKLNDIVKYAPEADIQDLNLVLIIFSFTPMFILKWLVKLMGNATQNGKLGLIPTTLRQLDLGLRGILYSSYYGEFTNPEYKGRTPMELIDYTPNRIPN